MMRTLWYVLLGYLSGSVLYARVFEKLFRKEGMIEDSRDKNPGAANAYMNGGFWCGTLTLVCDLLKGALPVYLFLQGAQPAGGAAALAAVLAAPVVGHAFPVFYRGRGGKGIAVSFGCLIGLLPMWQPLVTLAAYFIFFSTIVRIYPHFYRTLVAYGCCLASFIARMEQGLTLGFLIITVVVAIRMFRSVEDKGRIKVGLLWMH